MAEPEQEVTLQDLLKKLKVKTAEELLRLIEKGDADDKVLAVACKFLKDNSKAPSKSDSDDEENEESDEVIENLRKKFPHAPFPSVLRGDEQREAQGVAAV